MPKSVDVKIRFDDAMLRQLEALPNKHTGNPVKNPSPSQIEVLRRGWKTKRQKDVAVVLGVAVSTALKWYREYIEEA
jgi:DNA-binding transcriptional regulator YiaG